MVSKKYLQDYKTEYSETVNGKLKAGAVYVGKHFNFVESPASIRRTRRSFALLSALIWFAFFMPLFFRSLAARTIYVIFPHAIVFLPLLGMSSAVCGMWTVKPPLTREQNDSISHKVPASALLMTLLSGLAAVGFLYRSIVYPDAMLFPGDLIFGVCEAILFTASFILFRARKRMATRETQ